VGAQSDVAAEAGHIVEGVGVSNTAEDDLDASGIPYGVGAGAVPSSFELSEAVADGDDEDALAGAVGHPAGQGDGADLGDFVEGHEHGRVESAVWLERANEGGSGVDVFGERAEQGRDGGLFAAAADHVE